MICKNCNKEIDDESVFCRFCGSVVEEKKDTAMKWQKIHEDERKQKIKKGVIIGCVCLGLVLYLHILLDVDNGDDLSDDEYYSEEYEEEYEEDYSSEDTYEDDYDTYDSADSSENDSDYQVNYRTGTSDDAYEDTPASILEDAWEELHEND